MITLDQIKKLLEGNNRRRDENLDEKLNQLRIDLNTSIDKRIKHLRTAPETEAQLNSFRENCKVVSGNYGSQIETLTAIIEENQRMTKEMYAVFANANWSGKFALKTFTTIGIITGGIIGCIELFKRIR